MNHQEPSRFQALLPWLHAGLTGLVVGFFFARVIFELWPAQQAALATWPGTLSAVAISVSIALALRWLWSRLVLGFANMDAERARRNPYPLPPFLLLLIYLFWPHVSLSVAAILFMAAVVLSVALALRDFIAVERHAVLNQATLAMLIVVALAAYLQTMGQTVGAADAFEFQVVAPTLGVAHPTGYPLLVMIGKLFSLIPFGQVAWRVNLVSATCATAATTLTYLVLLKLTQRRVISALAALSLAFSRVFWSQAVEIEVYTLNAAFVCAILWLLIAGQDDSVPNKQGWLFALAAVYGLSFSNHLTMVIMAPSIALGVILARPRLERKDWLIAVGCFLAPLLTELFIPLRWPALHNGQWMSFGEFITYISGQQFRGAMQFGLWRDPTRWSIVSGLMLHAFGQIGAALAAIGLAWLAARKWRIALITFGAFAGYWFYGLVYIVPDISVFVIPAYIIMATWIGASVSWLVNLLVDWLAKRTGGQATNWLTALACTAFAILPLSLAWTNGPLVNQSDAGWDLYRWGKYVMDLPMPIGSAILADSEKIAPLYYLKRIENARPDVDTLVLGDEGLYRAKLDQLVAEGKPTYLARYLPGLAGPYRLHSLGPLVRVTTKPMTSPPPMKQQLNNVNWGGGQVALLGLDVEPGQGHVAWRITLYWLARTKLDTSYHIRLRWVGPGGHVWWQDHGAHPVNGFYPTVAWQSGEVIADYHEIPADPAIPPGLFRFDVGLFLPFLDEGLKRDGADNPWFAAALLEQLPVASHTPSAQAMRANFGDELLVTGANDLGVLPPAEPVNVVFEWSRIKPGPDRKLRLRWMDARGAEIAATEIDPYAGDYPTSQWPLGQALMSRVNISAPSNPGMYSLRAAWLDSEGRELPARCAWLAATSRDCAVGTLRVEGEAYPGRQGINFDNQVLLLDAKIGQTQLRPNETLPVNLKWQGLRQWNADYTVFVHLIGPDGKLHGQVDQWPLDGTLATRDWSPGRAIDDPYRVTLTGDAPPGTYQVEVGWYLLATLRRLPVVDAEGRPVDDRVIVGTVNVGGQ